MKSWPISVGERQIYEVPRRSDTMKIVSRALAHTILSWLGCPAGGAGNHHQLAVRIAQPDFPLVGCRIDARVLDHLRTEVSSPLHGGMEILDHEPQEHPVPRRRSGAVYQVGMVLLVPGMELQDHPAGREEPVIEVPVRMFGQELSSTSPERTAVDLRRSSRAC